MSAALQEFASEVGAGPDKRIALVIDGAGWHSAPDVVVPDGVHLIFQPPYSPEVQPSEQLWPLLHEPLANRDFVDMDEHAAVTAARCRELSASPDVVQGRTLFHWWPADRAPCAERAAS
jgi:transposase